MSPPQKRSTTRSTISRHRGPTNRATRRARQQIRPRGHHRRPSRWAQIAAWLTVSPRERRERVTFAAEMRELRLAAAALRAELSVLRHQFEVAVDTFTPEMVALRSELEAATAELRNEIAELRAGFELSAAAARHEMSTLRERLKDATAFAAELEAEAEITILLPDTPDYVGPTAPPPQRTIPPVRPLVAMQSAPMVELLSA